MDDVRRILLAFVLLGFPSSALAQGFTPVPDVPPKASLITISTPDSSNIVVGLRGRYNERADFLVTTTSPVNEGGIAPTSELLFPHLADWGGYTSQFILFSGTTDQTASGKANCSQLIGLIRAR